MTEVIIGGRFKRLEQIGAGGMGSVYKGYDQQTSEWVAIKELKPDIIKQDPEIIERFAREGEALRKLNHPSIVKVIATVQENDSHYLILEYVEGGSLRDLMDETPQLAIETILELALDLSDALARAHRLDIVHRDLKPANVLIATDGTPRLTDFGIARIGASPMTQTGVIMGTMAYLPPEALSSQRIDQRADIWAFGVMLYEMCAGERPFDGDNTGALLNAILNKQPPDILEYRDSDDFSSWGLPGLIYWMLEKDRDKRPSSARLVGAMVENLIAGVELPAWTSSSLPENSLSGVIPQQAANAIRDYTTSGFDINELNAALAAIDTPDPITVELTEDIDWQADPVITRSDWSIELKRKLDHPPRIFMSYRRSDSIAFAGRIYDRLVMAFGAENIFKDVMNIPAGADFKQVIEQEIKKADVALIIIGSTWATVTNEEGRRLDNPEDVVRFEVETALQKKDMLVIPVIVENAVMPKPDLLPKSLQPLTYHNGATVRNDPDFNRDAEWLISQISNAFEVKTTGQTNNTRRVLMASGAIVATILIIGLIWAVISNQGDNNNSAIAGIPETCNADPVADNEFMVLVAQPERITGEARDVQRFIAEDLTEHLEIAAPTSQHRIRTSETIIRTDEEARQLSELCGAIVIIWGNYDDERVEMAVQLGDLSVFPTTFVFSEEDVRFISDSRYQMMNEREETLVYGVIGAINMGWTASNEGYVIAENLTFLQLVETTPATVMGSSASSRYHEYIQLYQTDIERSIESLDRAIQANGANSLLYAARALAYLRANETASFLEDNSSANTFAPDNWVIPAFNSANHEVYLQNDLEASIPYLDEFVAQRPDDWFILAYRGSVHYLIGNYDLATEDINQSIANNPTGNIPYGAGSMLAIREGDFITTTAYFDIVQTQFPDPALTQRVVTATFSDEIEVNEMMLFISAIGSFSLERWNSVIESVDEAFELGFIHPDMYFLRGFAQCNLGDYEGAEASYTQALELDDELYFVNLLRAEVRLSQGLNRSGDALADIQVVINSPQAELYEPITSLGVTAPATVNCETLLDIDWTTFGSDEEEG